MVGGDSCILWMSALFLYVTPVFIVAQFYVYHNFIYIFGFLVLKPWLLWIVTSQTVTNWGLPVINPSGVRYCTVTGWVCSNIWKEHTKRRTQLHRITYQHTKILNPLPFWAFTVTFDTLTLRILCTKYLEKKHDQEKQWRKPFWTVFVKDAT